MPPVRPFRVRRLRRALCVSLGGERDDHPSPRVIKVSCKTAAAVSFLEVELPCVMAQHAVLELERDVSAQVFDDKMLHDHGVWPMAEVYDSMFFSATSYGRDGGCSCRMLVKSDPPFRECHVGRSFAVCQLVAEEIWIDRNGCYVVNLSVCAYRLRSPSSLSHLMSTHAAVLPSHLGVDATSFVSGRSRVTLSACKRFAHLQTGSDTEVRFERHVLLRETDLVRTRFWPRTRCRMSEYDKSKQELRVFWPSGELHLKCASSTTTLYGRCAELLCKSHGSRFLPGSVRVVVHTQRSLQIVVDGVLRYVRRLPVFGRTLTCAPVPMLKDLTLRASYRTNGLVCIHDAAGRVTEVHVVWDPRETEYDAAAPDGYITFRVDARDRVCALLSASETFTLVPALPLADVTCANRESLRSWVSRVLTCVADQRMETLVA